LSLLRGRRRAAEGGHLPAEPDQVQEHPALNDLPLLESIDDETLQGNAAVRCRLPIERTLVNCADEERSGDPITFLDLLHDLETHVAERIIESLGGAAHDLQSKGRAVH